MLDGVLEVEHRREFVSGVDAHELLLAAAGTSAHGRTVALSHAALRYGQALDRLPSETLALRLYLFGRRPLTAALRRLLPTEDSVTAALGLDSGGSVRSLLGRAWVEDPSWRRACPLADAPPRGVRRNPERHGGAKLYVSPHPEQVGESIAAVADVLGDRAGVVGFKVARDVGGLCRPDKLVCYFARVEDLHEAVGRCSLGSRASPRTVCRSPRRSTPRVSFHGGSTHPTIPRVPRPARGRAGAFGSHASPRSCS